MFETRYDGENVVVDGVSLKENKMPRKYHSIVKQLKARGFPDSAAWPIAVENVARGCLRGETTLPKKGGKGEKIKLSKAARAEYCAAYSQWRANHKGTGYGKRYGRG